MPPQIESPPSQAGDAPAASAKGNLSDGPPSKTHIYFGPVSGTAPAGVAAVSDVTGEVDTGSGGQEVEAEPAVQRHQELLKRFEIQQKASNFQAVCPTHDRTVKKVLRALGHPICLFGEGPFERRQRLKLLFAEGVTLPQEELQKFTLEDESLSRAKRAGIEEAAAEDVADGNELFFTEGSPSLLEARRFLLEDSVRRSRLRLRQEQLLKRDVPKPVSLKSQAALLLSPSATLSPLPKRSVLRSLCRFCSHLQNQLAVRASQVGDDRPLTCCRFSPGSSRLLRFVLASPERADVEGDVETEAAPLKRVKTEPTESDMDEARNAWEEDEGVRFCGEKRQDLNEDPLLLQSWGGDSQFLATSSWNEVVKLWSVQDGELLQELRGHTGRVHALAWRDTPEGEAPRSSDTAQKGGVPLLLASGGADGAICLWDIHRMHTRSSGLESSAKTPHSNQNSRDLLVFQLEGHEDRVNRLAFHPSGRYLASTSHDETWRFWDIETQQELLLQEGHAAAVYGVSIHPDGSLIVTTDLSGIVRVWDLRTGRTVMPLVGHVKQVVSASFHPIMGNIVATASDDHSVKIWDLRKGMSKQSQGASASNNGPQPGGSHSNKPSSNIITTVLAHNKLVTEVLFEPIYGRCMYTSSFDGLVKVWSVNDFACLKTLAAHEGRVMSMDVMKGGEILASVGFDRTWKLWKCGSHFYASSPKTEKSEPRETKSEAEQEK
ncbi:putative U4/U6 small nuclear ribonucleoprotein [Neospora caninum Liverpool]|uniref:Putative U4/U6 small nuclear ribonucleoprotein n=1 Tax=Neospora caninum (strain Liverpool) TaxID=572307 RepID=F0VE92_NEOCL|nr:putative U4/U6 small nuclear ribonucleoprotein [Neospora caninum Liverpool]CBZ52036.1 putative U4/U6 small nuclear ribonucleoprotein [Neospora caninum Liverpool]CEL65997.1 TPA: U4/U6 small nuclear ribonucleoprotein, putative [Neospora caninum Liverpool]|eukprot:XP_003882068.1 putative U4/U6 small nuclear ribonucleoprotein [Neospora caninum Liverpool]